MPEDFDALVQQMRACRLCSGLPLGPRPIFQLNPAAKILIVGQAPGRITHAKGRPFDDPSGDRLRQWLNIDKATFYQDPRIGIFPMGLCFPGTGKGGDMPPVALCAETWRRPVLDRLQTIELTLILGTYAIGWHLPELSKMPVAEAVRHAAQARGGNYVLPHPSPRNIRWLKQNLWFEADIIPQIRHDIHAILS